MVPLPSGLIRVLSSRTYELKSMLIGGADFFPISFYPLLTRVEFFKWLSFVLFFFVVVYGGIFDSRGFRQLVLVVFLSGVFQWSSSCSLFKGGGCCFWDFY